MRSVRLRRPSPALVVATLALIVALSGNSFADVGRLVSGNKLIKRHSLSGNRLHSHTLTRAQINMAKLGTVPNANRASRADSLASPEAFHEIGAAGEPPFQNGCLNEPFVGSAAFFIDREGVVHLRGRYNCPVSGDTAFTLPPDYRPGGEQQFPLAGAGAGAVIDVGTDGQVKCGSKTCFVNGISFRAGA